MERFKKGFVLYKDYWEHLNVLETIELGELFKGIFLYAREGEEPEFNGEMRMAWSFIKLQLDRDNEKYIARCVKNAENGAKGGRPKASKESDEEEPEFLRNA